MQNNGISGADESELNNDALKEIRLADIIAASSCFPGGFEPIAFPDDFIHGACKELINLKEEKFPIPIDLMDGGIYDNQGIDSIVNAQERREGYQELTEKGKVKSKNYLMPFDLIIVSDVSSPDMAAFEFFEEKQENFWRRLSLGKAVKYWSLSQLLFQIIHSSFAFLALSFIP